MSSRTRRPKGEPDRGRRALLSALPVIALSGLGGGASAWGQETAEAAQGARITDMNGDQVIDTFDAWIDAYGRPTAAVFLNGQSGFRFMVDTGANTTALALRHVKALGLTLDDEVQVNGTTGSANRPTVMLGRLATGAVTKDKLRLVVLPDDEIKRVDGILGADVFVGRRLSFNISRKTVRVEMSNRMAWAPESSSMRVRNGTLAEIDGRVGRVPARLMLDTGAETCIINPRLDALLRRAYPALKRQPSGMLTGVTGHQIVGDYVDLPRLTLGQVVVRDAGGIAADAPIFRLWGLEGEPTMIVGVNVLSRISTFTIDYGARRFDAQPMAELMARQSMMLG